MLSALILLCGIVQAEYAISAAGCKRFRQTSGYAGRFGWEDAPDHALVGASEARTKGEATLTCTWTLRLPVSHINLNLGRLHIAFSGTGGSGSGVLLLLSGGGEIRMQQQYLRTSGEDWIEVGARTYSLPFPAPTKRVQLTLKLIDDSDRVAMRVDLDSASLTRK